MFQNKLYIEITAKLSHFPPNGPPNEVVIFVFAQTADQISTDQISPEILCYRHVRSKQSAERVAERSVPFLDLLHVETRFT